jgi:hypothetical protein
MSALVLTLFCSVCRCITVHRLVKNKNKKARSEYYRCENGMHGHTFKVK